MLCIYPSLSTLRLEVSGIEVTRTGSAFLRNFSNSSDRSELVQRLGKVRPDSQPRWGSMSAHQMVCHLSDSFRAAMAEKYISPASTPFKRTVMKWWALWAPLPWPHGVKTRPEMDQKIGGTPPEDFAVDVEALRELMNRFCAWDKDYAPHATLGPLSRQERMRHAYLHVNHHLRQFGT